MPNSDSSEFIVITIFISAQTRQNNHNKILVNNY